MIALLTALSLFATADTQDDVIDKTRAAYYFLRRLNTPSGQPPVAFLVKEGTSQHGDTVPDTLVAAGQEMPDEFFQFDLRNIGTAPALTPLFGPYTDFMNFVRMHGEGYVFLTGLGTDDMRGRLLANIAATNRTGKVVTTNDQLPKEDLRHNAFVIQAKSTDVFAYETTIEDLQRHADYSVQIDGYRLDIHSGYRLRAVLADCAARLAPTTPVADARQQMAPPFLGFLHP